MSSRLQQYNLCFFHTSDPVHASWVDGSDNNSYANISLMFRELWDGLRNIANVLIIRNEFNKRGFSVSGHFQWSLYLTCNGKMSFNYKIDATLICYGYWKKMCK